MPAPGRPIRIAIVGGGCAAVAAAFELTRPELESRYEVTIYQMGWRLGGKGASGRGPAGRIEEHGLHVWMGWYENAFRLMRECYGELGRDWREAFTPASFIGITDRTPDGNWLPWTRTFPSMEGLPGDPLSAGTLPTVRDYALRILGLLRSLLNDIRLRTGEQPTTAEGPRRDLPALEALDALLRYGTVATLTGMLQGIALLEAALGSVVAQRDNVVLRFLDTLAIHARRLLESRLDQDFALRRVWQVIDLALATLKGQIRFGLLTDPRGFDAIDDYDCREWLLLNGASQASADSGYLRGLYGLAFAYEDGDFGKPRVSAGVALRGFMRAFFTYRGAFFWRMQGGMGDVVFAPFYEVLKRRGVRFEFFHRLRNVRLADRHLLSPGEGRHVTELHFDVQAEMRDGRAYAPLVSVKGMDCWPSRPDHAQLAGINGSPHDAPDFECHWNESRAASKTLRVGEHFDMVVLAVGIGALPHVCREIVAQDPRWREMVAHVKTVATQAFQLWLEPDMAELGWPLPAVTLSGFADPFDTYADMCHLLPHEAWEQPPRALAYFCSVLSDSEEAPSGREHPRWQRARVRRLAIDFLNRHMGHLCPKAVAAPGVFRWDLLRMPQGNGARGAQGEARFDSQFWTANVNPSDRYTLALPGSSKYRISPLDRTYDNLTVAGDWTDCGVNTGCVEAAVIAGRLAAHAIAESPRIEDIVGYDHP